MLARNDPANQANRQLILPALPAQLAATERKVAELYARRAALVERHRAAIEVQCTADEVADLESELVALGEQIQVAKAERAKLRDEFGAHARQALDTPITAYETEVHHQIDLLEDLLRCGLRLHADAVRAGIDLQPVIGRSREAAAALRVCRASLSNGTGRPNGKARKARREDLTAAVSAVADIKGN